MNEFINALFFAATFTAGVATGFAASIGILTIIKHRKEDK